MNTTLKQRLFENGLINAISWSELSRKYLGKSNSWLYHKLDGKDGNGKPNDFTSEELSKLKDALKDLSARISDFADSI